MKIKNTRVKIIVEEIDEVAKRASVWRREKLPSAKLSHSSEDT